MRTPDAVHEIDFVMLHEEAPLRGSQFNWKDVLSRIPLFGLIVAASPHLKSLTTVAISDIQVDWLFYGLSSYVIIAKPSALFQGFPFKFFLLCILSLFAVIVEGLWDPTRGIVDTFSLWLIYSATFYLVNKCGVHICFQVYLAVSSLIAVYGIIEFAAGQTSAYGLDGLSYEPSHYVAVAAPAAMYAVLSQQVPRWMKFVLPASLLLTLSTTGLVLFTLVSLLALRKRLLLAALFAIAGVGLWRSNIALQERVLTRIQDEALTEGADNTGFGANRTTASLLSNWHVAKCSFRDYFPFGSGYSNHHLKYEQVFAGSIFYDSYFYGTNKKSGHNLAVRWISEFGFIGVIVLLGFVLKVVKARRKLDVLSWMVIVSSSMHFVGKSIKLGSYLDYGTPFFLSLIVVVLQQTDIT